MQHNEECERQDKKNRNMSDRSFRKGEQRKMGEVFTAKSNRA